MRPRTPRALALGWTGAATLAFDARRLQREHTLFVRFMPAYEGAYRGVVVSDSTGQYRLGMAPYASLSQPAVEAHLGAEIVTAPLPDPILSNHDFRYGAPPQRAPRWLTLALSLGAQHADLYLNGEALGTLKPAALSLAGPLRLGRLARAQALQDQFYGLIDDVAIFERALSASEVRALSRAERVEPRLEGLLALVSFDDTETSGAELAVERIGAAQLVPVSKHRDVRADAAQLTHPLGARRLELPFESGQIWTVIQGANSAGSHHDTSAFAIDLQRVDPALVHHNPERKSGGSALHSQGQVIRAAAAGEVVAVVDCFAQRGRGTCVMDGSAAPEGERAWRNLVCVEHTPGDVGCYLHIEQARARVKRGARVAAGAALASVGASGTQTAHLHLALSDRSEPNQPGTFSDLVTIPFELGPHEVSNDFGRSWQRVDSALPRPGQWLRAVRP
ncbi:MAG: LamG-like jellyroll fold domain-containing protein [Myxococcota bacterium]